MREKICLDRNWKFALGHAANPARDFEFARSRCLVKAGEARGAAGVVFDDSKWKTVDVPHDWAIELPLDPNGDKELAEHGFRAIGPDHPEHSVGWYRQTFQVPRSDLGKRITLEFDGVFRDSVVWINGHRLGRHASGYTSFAYDITDFLNYGPKEGTKDHEGKNVIAVRVDATSWEGWWYEGAGIYRHVWLTKTAPVHVARHGTCVTSQIKKGSATLTIQTTVQNDSSDDCAIEILSSIIDPRGNMVAQSTTKGSSRLLESSNVEQVVKIKSPLLWDCDNPHLYTLISTIKQGNKTLDEYVTTFGIREFSWNAKKGFFLNGKHVKIKGTCNHHQHAGVGVAMPDSLHRWRIARLKELGSNAYRCSHYMMASELLDECDRAGMLVLAENRLAGSSPEVLGQFEEMIRRDRNHASIFAWSLANEEHSVQWKIAGERIGQTMVNLAHKLDPTRKVTTAMHDRGLGEGFANIVDVHGWNYMKVGNIEEHHKRKPNVPILGSEESSTVTTRGEYVDDANKGYVASYDKRTPGWGTTAEKWWKFFSEREWLAGGFVWTGFDYFGEPIPYKWPCTASHFGLMDMCGFPKDLFYYYQSWWQEGLVLHLFPHWNWPGKEGRKIEVWAFSNCDEVELFCNGTSQGRQKVEKNSHVQWEVIYEPGEIRAVGYKNGIELETKRQTTGPVKSLKLLTTEPKIRADGDDVSIIAVIGVDDAGREVPVANNLVEFTITGPGKIIGVGNGDPSSHEADKASYRKLFNGRACAIVQSTDKKGTIEITATSQGLPKASISVKSR